MNLRLFAAGAGLLVLVSSASAQEFKRAARVPRERYVFGLPVVKVKEGSRFAALKLLPGGWDCFIVAVNRAPIPGVTDFDGPEPDVRQKVQDCTKIHADLGRTKVALELTISVRKSGNSRGTLLHVSFPEWDAGLVYAVKKWSHDTGLVFFPGASTGPGAEPFYAKIRYTERERLFEVAEFERQKRDKEALRKDAKTPLRALEGFQVSQRRFRADLGLGPGSSEDRAFIDARSDRASGLSFQSTELQGLNEWVDAYRAGVEATACMRGPGGGEAIAAMARKLPVQDRNRVRAKAASEAQADLGGRRYVEAAKAFKLLALLGEPGAAKSVESARRAALEAKEIDRDDFDLWWTIAGPFTPFPPAAGLKDDQPYLLNAKVVKAGKFTLIECGTERCVFQDRPGLGFEAGDEFLMLGVYDAGKAPSDMPEEWKELPRVRLVVVR
jgi:hypothetical protein